MTETIDHFIIHKDLVREKLKIWVRDTSIPLQQRWETFIKSGLGTEDVFINRLDDNKVMSTYIDCLDERYTTEYVDSILNWAVELRTDYDFTNEDIDEFKQDVLNNFLKSFKHDW